MRVAIYLRVSTEGQDLVQQRDTCLKFLAFKGWSDFEVVEEVGSAGKFRPVFRGLIKKASEGLYGCIVVFRIDRAWRSSREFIMDFDTLQAKGIQIVSVMEGFDPTTPMGKAMMTVVVALAELEKANIGLATRQRLAALRNLGRTLGRPVGAKDRGKRKVTGYLVRQAKLRGDNKQAENLMFLAGGK